MKKYYAIISCFIICYSPLLAQDSTCEKQIEKAKKLLLEKSPFNNEDIIFQLVEPCALSGNSEAENLLATLYIKGIGTEIDNSKAFTLFNNSAEKGNSKAQYNVGRMYKTGVGCQISHSKAIEWFEKSSNNGNQRASYTLGYMYYKGLGVPQSYENALEWFNKSDDPMAKHFLGLCYYQGYGVTANESKALEILLTNNIINSKTLVTYIKNNQKENNENLIENLIADESAVSSEDNINLSSSLNIQIEDIVEEEIPTIEELEGDWIGKMIQYDWSGKK
ncbi:sel1 repeat family protein [Cellulophaga baltica 4]|nr:sel1 repeat family protein [Cellulophaga baltica 4]